jgi:signal peptidase II
MNPRLKILIFCLSTLAFIGCDRVTKDLAKEHLQNQVPLSFLHNSFRLVYVENTGAAMSLGDNLPKAASFWLLSMLPLLFLLAFALYALKKMKELNIIKIISFSLIIAGGLGNIIDRIVFDRHVTDFMILGFWKIQTGVFNVADVCVTAGAIGLMLFYRDKPSTANTGTETS